MAYFTRRGELSWRLVIPMGYDARGKMRTPMTKTYRIEDPVLLQTIDKLQEYDPTSLKATKALKKFLDKKDVPVTVMRHAKKLDQHFDEMLMKFKIEVENGTHKKNPGRIPFAEFESFWDEHHVSGLEFKTRQNYRYHCKTRIVPYFEAMFLDEISTAHLVKFMTDLRNPETKIGKRLDGKPGPLQSATLVYIYRVLKSIFSKAVKWKKLEDNPMDGVDKPEENDVKKPGAYSEAELEQLFEAMEKDIYNETRYKQPRYAFERLMFQVLVTLDLTTGMRRAELLGLKRNKFVFTYNSEKQIWNGTCEVLDTIPAFEDGKPVIKRPKNDEPRLFALSSSIVEMLIDYFNTIEKLMRIAAGKENVIDINNSEDDYYIFQNLKTGNPLYPSSIGKKWATFHERNPHLKYIPFHGIRHTATSIMIAKNVHSKAIAKRLGWKSTKMVDRYGKIFASVDEAAAEVFEDLLPTRKSNG